MKGTRPRLHAESALAGLSFSKIPSGLDSHWRASSCSRVLTSVSRPASFSLLTAPNIPARADELVQNLGPVVPHEPILTAVGSTLHRKTWHPSLSARGRAARMSERDRDRTLKPRRINVAQVPQTDVGILGLPITCRCVASVPQPRSSPAVFAFSCRAH